MVQSFKTMKKRHKFLKGEIYHVFNRSIAHFNIFNDLNNSQRFIQSLAYYNNPNNTFSLSTFLKNNKDYDQNLLIFEKINNVKFICHHIMPDHYHLLVKILKDNFFSKYLGDVENSFSKFFNNKFRRKGPLWESRFKTVKIKTNEQLLHVSRYIHLNSTTAGLVDKPEDWVFSSYKQIINDPKILKEVLTEISISNNNIYKKFTEDRIDYQRRLKKIKNLIIDDK